MEEINSTHIGHILFGNNIIAGDINCYEFSKEETINYMADVLFKRDQTNKENHFNLFGFERAISDVHQDGNYDIQILDIDQKDYGNQYYSKGSIGGCLNILFENNVLLITGDYGQGKTMLSKALQLQCRQKNYASVFFRAYDLIRGFDNELKFFSDVFISMLEKTNSQRLIVFIDSIDELNYNELINTLFENIFLCIYANRNIFFVVNSRVYYKIHHQPTHIEEITDVFFEKFIDYDHLSRKKVLYVKMNNFDTQLDNLFFSLNKTGKYEMTLNKEYIKKTYKHIVAACSIPLFAYVIGDYYYSNEYKLPTTFSDVYNSFIKKTIKGKFSQEQSYNPLIKDIAFQYHALLKLLAIFMINKTSHFLNYSDTEEGFFSDNIKYPYYIELSKLSHETEIIKSITEFKSYYSEEYKENTYADFLNCYFFKVLNTENGYVFSFSDENTMCYLASEYVFDTLLSLSNKDYDSVKNFRNIIDILEQFFPHPIAMDFLIERINSEIISDDTKKFVFIHNLKITLNQMKENSLQVTEESVSLKGIMAEIILMIVFIKTNQDSYKSIDDNHFFKRFYLLSKVAKELDLNGQHSSQSDHHRYLIERYFSDCVINNALFRRINLKFFNFNRSKLKKCTFSQCKFFQSSLCSTEFIDKTTFILCEFNTVVFSSNMISGIIEFKDSTIIGCKFIDVNCNGIILFNNCRISRLELLAKNSNNKIRIIFKNCSIQHISVGPGKAIIAICRCLFPNNETIKIKDKTTEVRLITKDNISEISCDSEYKPPNDNFYKAEKEKGIDWESYLK